MYTTSQIAKKVGGEVNGNSKLLIKGVCDLKNGFSDGISYVSSKKYEKTLFQSKVKAVLIDKNSKFTRDGKTFIYVDNPALKFIDVINLYHPIKQAESFIHPTSIISDTAQIGTNVNIGANVIIEDNVKIDNNTKIDAGAYIGEGARIGKNTIIYPNVVLYHNTHIGSSCIIDSGTVIGADGFGLVKDNNSYKKMPHLGSVIIENDVWIGANCCIDRGTLNNTIIGKGSKLDNLIQIAHNVNIGSNCRISGQTAIAGSTIIEDNVTLAGQVGIIDHLIIGKGTTVASKTAVYQSVKPKSIVSGIPAKDHKDRLRQEVIINQLPEMMSRLRKLEKKLK